MDARLKDSGLLPIFIWLCLSYTAMADDLKIPQIYKNPGNRYTYAHPGGSVPAHWTEKITARFSGISDPAVRRKVLTDFLHFSDAAGYDISLDGFPAAVFSDEPPSSDVNFFVTEVPDSELKKLVASPPEDFPDTPKTLPDGVVKRILKNPLVVVFPGCAVRWDVSDSDVIQGFVLSFSQDLSESEKLTCINDGLPRGFGIFSLSTIYNISIKQFSTGTVYNLSLADRSERILELSALRACREVIPEYDRSCPYYMINRIFGYHGQISGEGGQ